MCAIIDTMPSTAHTYIYGMVWYTMYNLWQKQKLLSHSALIYCKLNQVKVEKYKYEHKFKYKYRLTDK